MMEDQISTERPSPGFSVRMIRCNMENIPQFDFPDGFGIRTMKAGEDGIWVDIIRDAEEYLDIHDDRFIREFGDDLPATEQRCLFIIDPYGKPVGTISAWYSVDEDGQSWGRIHWVATRPAYQGRGLGKAGLTYAMNRLAEWHDRCWLSTATARLAAIKMYLDFGFKPDTSIPGALVGWHKVKARLNHPALEDLP